MEEWKEETFDRDASDSESWSRKLVCIANLPLVFFRNLGRSRALQGSYIQIMAY